MTREKMQEIEPAEELTREERKVLETPADPETLEAIAVQAARIGAKEISSLTQLPHIEREEKSSRSDYVTAADKASEAAIVAFLRAQRPNDTIVGEEGAAHDGTSGITWVIDPLDGTTNFVLQMPWYAVSVAATRDRVPVAGCVVHVATGDCYSASQGNPARKNGDVLSLRTVPVENGRAGDEGATGAQETVQKKMSLEECVIATGFAYKEAHRAHEAEVLQRVLPAVGNMRRLGSAALDLCLVATGQVHGYFEYYVREWDIAAGVLIAQCAGAKTTMTKLEDKFYYVLAARPDIADELARFSQDS